MLYSLLGTCKMHGIEPYTWLKEVLRIIAYHPVNRIAELSRTDTKNSLLHQDVVGRWDTFISIYT
ncbi:MAG: transposase domain-containing protein [Chitinophagales bacterium]|nr:transposase domain-containing protein [Chitinophagales bacterium]